MPLCFSLLLIYLVPFFLFVRYTRMRAGVPRWLVVLAVLGLAGRREGRDWLVGGMCVGMGFQLFEAFFCLIVAVPFLYTWGDITFDGGRRLSAPRPRRRKRHVAHGTPSSHDAREDAAPGEKDAGLAPQPPRDL